MQKQDTFLNSSQTFPKTQNASCGEAPGNTAASDGAQPSGRFDRIILASGSPRRRELLATFGFPFTVMTADADEQSTLTDPHALVRQLATRKADAVYRRLCASAPNGSAVADASLIIAADTVVFAGGEILGKPRSRADAERMLMLLSDATHSVLTGICVMGAGKTVCDSVATEVHLAPIPDAEREAYLETEEPYDKAGAYAIQGRAALWITGICGCYYNVVGLPLSRLHQILSSSFGVTAAHGGSR